LLHTTFAHNDILLYLRNVGYHKVSMYRLLFRFKRIPRPKQKDIWPQIRANSKIKLKETVQNYGAAYNKLVL